MQPTTNDESILESRLEDISRGIRQANRKLDRLVYLLEDGYFRAFYEQYDRHRYD